MAYLGAIFALGKNLGAGLGHEDSVFELGGETSVPGSYGPVIFGVEFRESGTGIDHRFDGKAHACEESVLLAFSIWEVGDVRVLMEATPESVTDVFANDRKPPLGRFRDDVVTNDAYGAPRF